MPFVLVLLLGIFLSDLHSLTHSLTRSLSLSLPTALRIELFGIALVKWDASDAADVLIDPDEKLEGDCNREQFFHRKVALLERGNDDVTLPYSRVPMKHAWSPGWR